MFRSLLNRKKPPPNPTGAGGSGEPDISADISANIAANAPPNAIDAEEGGAEPEEGEKGKQNGPAQGGRNASQKKKTNEFAPRLSKSGKNLGVHVGDGTKKETKKEEQVPLDLLGNILFLQGKLKELTDNISGPEHVRLMSRGQPDLLLTKLMAYLRGEDETTDKIRRGLALSDASRHRPDIGHPSPMKALEVFQAPKFAALRKFPDVSQDSILQAWQKASQEFLLASTVICFLKFAEVETQYTRETVCAQAMVEAMVFTCGPVLHNRHQSMVKEPEMTHQNMLSMAFKSWSQSSEGSEQQYRQMVVKEWLELRREDVLCIMEENVEDRSPGGDPLWGTVDYKFERVKISTPFFNFMDFIVNFLDFAYDKGYVFKPSAKPPASWTNSEVVEWFSNLRLYDYLDKMRASGVTGQALLECTLVDLECGLEIDDEKARTKVWRGLETLRATARYESAARLERETRCLITLKVPKGAGGGGSMVIQDNMGKNVVVNIPEKTVDRTQKMGPGMSFRIKQTNKKFVLNKWQAAKNQAVADIGGYKGVIKPGHERTARNLWKGAISKVRIMNLLESKVNRVLRMCQTSDTLRLTAMDLSYKDAMSVHDFLLVNNVCRQLELSFNNIGAQGATSLANALRDNRSISEVRMSSCQIGDEGALELSAMLRVSEAIQELDLGDNGLTDRSGVALFAACARSPARRDTLGQKIEGTHTIKRIMLYKNQLAHQTAQAWGKCMKHHSELIVDLTDNPLGDHGMESLAKVLTKYWSQNRLDMRSMRFGPEGLRPLSLVLANNSWRTVTSLYLSGNNLGVTGATHLALILEKSLSLLELDLSGCALGDEGVRYIAKAMEQNERLECLDLGDNRVTAQGVQYLADILAAKGQRALARPHLYPFSLRRVVLATNPMESEGFSIFSAVVTLAHLHTIEVACCGIKDDGCRVLAQHLQKNRTLKVIDLSSNLLTADGVWVIAEPLKTSESLDALRVNDNRLCDSGARALASILKSNFSIREINAAGCGFNTKGAGVLVKVLVGRPVPLELHLHGNPCTSDAVFLEMEAKLYKKNRVMTIHR